MTVTGLAAVLLGLESVVSLQVSGPCPGSEDIARELAGVIGEVRPAEQPDLATVDSTSGTVRLELHRADGTLVGEKQFDPAANCAELAQAVAVVIAAWELQLRDTNTQPPTTDDSHEAVPKPVPQPAPPPRLLPAAPPQPIWQLEFGAGPTLVAPDVTPGVLLFLAARKSAWSGRLTAGTSAWHQTPLGPGTAKWARTYAGLGLGYGWRWRRFLLELNGDVLAAVLWASSDGYRPGWSMRSQVTDDAGLGAGVRLSGPLPSRLRGWAALDTMIWPREHTLRVADRSGASLESTNLPHFELLLSLGLSFTVPM